MEYNEKKGVYTFPAPKNPVITNMGIFATRLGSSASTTAAKNKVTTKGE